MQRILLLLLGALLLPATLPAADTLRIIHLNDTHSNLAPGGSRNQDLRGTVGGIARTAQAIIETKMEHSNVLVLHAGDIYVGDLFFQTTFGVAELRILRELGVNAITLGNHEFDLTPQALQLTLETAFVEGPPIPILSANTILEDPGVEGLRPFVSANTTMMAGNVKVGVFGMTTPETNILSLPAPAVIDTNIVQIAAAQVTALRQQGCQVVVMLSHLGRDLDAIVASYVPGIDLIVGGHDHDVILGEEPGVSTPIVQAGSYYRSGGMALLEVDGGTVRFLRDEFLTFDETFPEEPTIAALVDGLIADIEETYGPVYTEQIALATADIEELGQDLTVAGMRDTPLGDLVCDAYRAWGETDIAVTACGSMAQPLFAGPLVSVDAFKSVGYGFNLANGLGYRMATFTVLGAEMLAGLEFGLSGIEHNDEFFVQVSGLSYTYDPTQPAYGRLVEVAINGIPIDPQSRYSVTANEMILMFFQYLGMTPQDVEVSEQITEYLVFAAYLKALGTVSPVVDGRILCSPSTSVHESIPMARTWFSAEARDGMVSIDLDVPFSDGATVAMYTSGMRQLVITASVVPSDRGTRVQVPVGALSSGMYLMTVQVGSEVRAGRVLISR